MKFKVGDKVKIREDLKADKMYGYIYFVSCMKKYKGKTATITTVTGRTYSLDIDKGGYNWDVEMFEKVEITRSELQSEINKLENENKKLYEEITSTRDKIANLKEELKKLKEPILDEVERKYLLGVIKPFRNKVDFIKKSNNSTKEYIVIVIKNDFNVFLPNFKKGTMYKGMTIDRKYTLKELGLDE